MIGATPLKGELLQPLHCFFNPLFSDSDGNPEISLTSVSETAPRRHNDPLFFDEPLAEIRRGIAFGDFCPDVESSLWFWHNDADGGESLW